MKGRIPIFLSAAFVLALVFYSLFKIKSSGPWPEMLHSSPPDYLSLFSSEALDSLDLVVSYKSEGRNALSFYLYNKRLDVLIYRIDLKKSVPLGDLIKTHGNFSRDFGDVYTEFSINKFEVSFNSSSAPLISDIFLSFGIDTIKFAKPSPNLILFHSISRGFSIGYKSSGHPDIYGVADFNRKTQLDLLFKEEGNSVYMLFAKSVGNTTFDPHILLGILR